MATVQEAWRVMGDRAVVADTAAQAARILQIVEHLDGVCARVWDACADQVPELEDAYQQARTELLGVSGELFLVSVRLRHVAG